MEAQYAFRAACLAVALCSFGAGHASGASYRSANFVVDAPSPEMADQIGRAAEKFRKDLAVEWLGHEMPNWAQPCPITAQVGDHLGAGGATSFVFEHGEVFGWKMQIQGSLVRILDSVLPHEVTHTVFATHFRQPLPRWADEGACTTVEHSSERNKQQKMLVEFLRTGRGIAFARMFAMKDYPRDVMPLYSQGYSVARFLVAQGGRQKFLDYLADGMNDDNWSRATQQHYGISNLASLQNTWLDWVRKGSPMQDLAAKDPTLVAAKNKPAPGRRSRPESNLIHRDPGPDAVAAAVKTPQRDNSEPSVYEMAFASKDTSKPGPAARDEAPAAPRRGPSSASILENEPAEVAADHDEAPAANRPRPAPGPGQVILQWSKPAAAEMATGGPGSAGASLR